MKTHLFFVAKNPSFLKRLTGVEELSPEEYVKVLELSEKIDHSETKFVPPAPGEPGFGRFLVKWRHPWYAGAEALEK